MQGVVSLSPIAKGSSSREIDREKNRILFFAISAVDLQREVVLRRSEFFLRYPVKDEIVLVRVHHRMTIEMKQESSGDGRYR